MIFIQGKRRLFLYLLETRLLIYRVFDLIIMKPIESQRPAHESDVRITSHCLRTKVLQGYLIAFQTKLLRLDVTSLSDLWVLVDFEQLSLKWRSCDHHMSCDPHIRVQIRISRECWIGILMVLYFEKIAEN